MLDIWFSRRSENHQQKNSQNFYITQEETTHEREGYTYTT